MAVLRVCLLVVALTLLTQTACGKKGPLYLPDTPRPARTDGAAPADALPDDDEPSLPAAPAAP